MGKIIFFRHLEFDDFKFLFARDEIKTAKSHITLRISKLGSKHAFEILPRESNFNFLLVFLLLSYFYLASWPTNTIFVFRPTPRQLTRTSFSDERVRSPPNPPFTQLLLLLHSVYIAFISCTTAPTRFTLQSTMASRTTLLKSHFVTNCFATEEARRIFSLFIRYIR